MQQHQLYPDAREVPVKQDRSDAPVLAIQITGSIASSLRTAKRWIARELNSCGGVLKTKEEAEQIPSYLELYNIVHGKLDLTRLCALNTSVNATHSLKLDGAAVESERKAGKTVYYLTFRLNLSAELER